MNDALLELIRERLFIDKDVGITETLFFSIPFTCTSGFCTPRSTVYTICATVL
jgi:hypothetical protein